MEITAGYSSSAPSDMSDSISIDSMNVEDANIAQSRSSVQERQDSSHQRQQSRHSLAGRGDLLTTRKNIATVPLCDCKPELLEEELRQFRRSSAEAIQNSWNEVETLQRTCMKYDEKIQEIRQEIEWKTTQLDDCLTRFDGLEQELEDLKDVDSSSRTTQQPSEHSNVDDNGHDVHQEDQEYQVRVSGDKEYQVRVSSRVQARDKERKRLKEILASRNSTIDCMEYVLSQNVKMMQNFQLKLQEREENGSDGFTFEPSRGFNDS